MRLLAHTIQEDVIFGIMAAAVRPRLPLAFYDLSGVTWVRLDVFRPHALDPKPVKHRHRTSQSRFVVVVFVIGSRACIALKMHRHAYLWEARSRISAFTGWHLGTFGFCYGDTVVHDDATPGWLTVCGTVTLHVCARLML